MTTIYNDLHPFINTPIPIKGNIDAITNTTTNTNTGTTTSTQHLLLNNQSFIHDMSVNVRSIGQRNVFDDSFSIISFESLSTIISNNNSNNNIIPTDNTMFSITNDSISSTTLLTSSSLLSNEQIVRLPIIESNHKVLSTTTTTTIEQPIIESIPSTTQDSYFTGIVIDTLLPNIIYYTNQKAIYSYNEDTKETNVIIAGMIEIVIEGYHLGMSINDIISIKIAGNTCTSIVHFSDQKVRCVLVLKDLLSTANLPYSEV